jgi:MFS family permease
MMNYRREETGRRMSYIFSCAAFAGAVGGLIAGGLVRIESGAMVGWQYLYIVSGTLRKFSFTTDMVPG